MRIATATAYTNMLSEIQNMGVEQANLQTEVSSGQSVTNPSDDPSAANQLDHLHVAVKLPFNIAWLGTVGTKTLSEM